MNEQLYTPNPAFNRFSDPPAGVFDGMSILVTGGTGSFGKALIRTVLRSYAPQRLIVFSRDELKQWEMQQRSDFGEGAPLRYFIGDVRDCGRLEIAMRDVDFVIHAAAMKHVPAAEYNPFECIHTNVLGAENVVRAAMGANVKKVLSLSTDKAANPINLYGASKLAADKIFTAANNLSGAGGTSFSTVRYGNVVGSRGSVIPLFLEKIHAGADSLPITDKRMTRFWMTLRQGVNFVLSCIETMRGGEIFVPKIPSMKIVDLARALAPDLPHRIIGIRPGEKVHEVIIPEDDGRSAVEMDDRYIIEPTFAFWDRKPYRNDGVRAVEPGFRYASDTNTEWLDNEGLHAMLRASAEVLG